MSGIAAGGQTVRTSSAAAGGATKRVSALLELEGDESGFLLFEGDMQTDGSDVLEIQGDATNIAGSQTKRVSA